MQNVAIAYIRRVTYWRISTRDIKPGRIQDPPPPPKKKRGGGAILQISGAPLGPRILL